MAIAAETIAHQLKNLGAELGKDDLSFTSGQAVTISLDTGLAVGIEWDEESEQLLIFSMVLEVPRNSDERLGLFQKVLEYNCFQVGSLGGVLSYHAASGSILYHMRVTVTPEAEPDALKQLVLDFGTRATVILSEISKEMPESDKPAAPARPADQIKA